MKIEYSSSFIKMFNSLEKDLADEVYEKLNLFKDKKNHKMLNVHKLHGALKNRYSFSVNYKIRIVFGFIEKNKAVMHAIGGHNLYKN